MSCEWHKVRRCLWCWVGLRVWAATEVMARSPSERSGHKGAFVGEAWEFWDAEAIPQAANMRVNRLAGRLAGTQEGEWALATYLHLVRLEQVSQPVPHELATFWHVPLLLGARPPMHLRQMPLIQALHRGSQSSHLFLSRKALG